MMGGTAAITRSISSSVLSTEREKRMVPVGRSGDAIAHDVGGAPGNPEVQAEPELATRCPVVQQSRDGLALDVLEGDVAGVGQAIGPRRETVGDLAGDARFESLSRGRRTSVFAWACWPGGHFAGPCLGRRWGGKPRCQPAGPLLVTAPQQQAEAWHPSGVVGTPIPWGVELVARKGGMSILVVFKSMGIAADGLDGVGVEHDALLGGQGGHFLHPGRSSPSPLLAHMTRNHTATPVAERRLVLIQVQTASLVLACGRCIPSFSSQSHGVRIAGCSTVVVMTVLRSKAGPGGGRDGD